jgi:hypothetical protein
VLWGSATNEKSLEYPHKVIKQLVVDIQTLSSASDPVTTGLSEEERSLGLTRGVTVVLRSGWDNSNVNPLGAGSMLTTIKSLTTPVLRLEDIKRIS